MRAMDVLPARCPQCGGPTETGAAGPRLTFCRQCRAWFTVGGRQLRRQRPQQV